MTLFAVPSGRLVEGTPPKCKSRASRRAAFELLSTLARANSKCWGALCELALPQHPMPSPSTLAAASVSSASSATTMYTTMYSTASAYKKVETGRSSTGYSGLVNPGCLCYMNATNQQLFMVPSFRRSILAIPGTEPPPAGSAASADERSSGAQVAYQLQRLFAFLQESEERAYNARPFYSVLKWRGDEGVGKVDSSAQQDASEYITQLVEQLPDYEEPFKRHFGGTMQTELLATSGRSGERLRKKGVFLFTVTF